MGSHLSYALIIRDLLQLKHEFYRLSKDKYQEVLHELSKHFFDPYSDDNHIGQKELASILGYKQAKLNALLRNIYIDLLDSFWEKPLEIHKQFCTIRIGRSHEEFEGDFMETVKKSSERLTYIRLMLPVLPRVGDEIEIPIVQQTGDYYRGYVHKVQHRIIGDKQEIYLWVHPWHNYYYQWSRMKEDYEDHQRQIKYEKAMADMRKATEVVTQTKTKKAR